MMHPTTRDRMPGCAIIAPPARAQASVKSSVDDGYRIEFAPIAQRSFGRLRFELVPAINGFSPRQQGAEFRVGASLAEYVSNLIKIFWQKFARKVQHQRLAEIEFSLVGDRDVFLIVVDIIGKAEKDELDDKQTEQAVQNMEQANTGFAASSKTVGASADELVNKLAGLAIVKEIGAAFKDWAVDATGMTDVPVENRTRLLSDNGAGYISRAFREGFDGVFVVSRKACLSGMSPRCSTASSAYPDI